MNELQHNCEKVEHELIAANKYLRERKIKKKQIDLMFQELDQNTKTLKNKYVDYDDEYKRAESLVMAYISPNKKEAPVIEGQVTFGGQGGILASNQSSRRQNPGVVFKAATTYDMVEGWVKDERIRQRKAEELEQRKRQELELNL